MKLNRKLELGIYAVEALNGKSSPVRSEDLAKRCGTTKSFMEQIMANLKKAGLTTAVKGPKGGNLLVDRDITAYDVAKAVKCKVDVFGAAGTTGLLELKLLEAYKTVKVYRGSTGMYNRTLG